MYIVFLDEFGHIGPYVSRNDDRFNQSPIFGLAGYIIPFEQVRNFGTWFYQMRNALLEKEIEQFSFHPATYEKKGNKLFNTKNVKKYPNVRSAMFRMTNEIDKKDGKIFFCGAQKRKSPNRHNPWALYKSTLEKSIQRIDQYCWQEDKKFLLVLDSHRDRKYMLDSAAKVMYSKRSMRLIELPFHVESYLYPTIQAADWIAAVIGRIYAYRSLPDEFSDWDWADTYFRERLRAVETHSSVSNIRRRRSGRF